MRFRSVLVAGVLAAFAFNLAAPDLAASAQRMAQAERGKRCDSKDGDCRKQDRKPKRQDERKDRDRSEERKRGGGEGAKPRSEKSDKRKDKRREDKSREDSGDRSRDRERAAEPKSKRPEKAERRRDRDSERTRERQRAPKQRTDPRARDKDRNGQDQRERDRAVQEKSAREKILRERDERVQEDRRRKVESDRREKAESRQSEASGKEQRRRERARARREQQEARDKAEARREEKAESTIERQLRAQGRGEKAERVRELREKLRRERQRDAARREEIDRDDDRRERDRDRRRDRRREGEFVEQRGDRTIVRFGAQIIIQPNGFDDRLLYGAEDVEVFDLGGGVTRTVVYRANGTQVVTIRDGYGDIITRVRILRDGSEIVLIDNRIIEEPGFYGYGPVALPPLVVPIPPEDYVVETRYASPLDIQTALAAPPVEAVERPYSLEEIRRSDRLRDKLRRIDLDTITFDFGSPVIDLDQIDSLDQVGEALEEILLEDPDELFLVEGHTDAVGSEEANLFLSDQRAEAVAVALSEDFAIPPENLVTQGYGEEFLKVPTEAPERENRRVTIRRITDLMRTATP